MVILGLNVYHGDASAAIVVDGCLVAAAEEERFSRIKHCAGFPAHAVRYCLEAAGVEPREIDHVAVARDPRARIWRKALCALRMPHLALDRLRAHVKFAGLYEELGQALGARSDELKAQVHRVEHHKAHLASSFFVSPFDQAALLSIDGLGDFASTMWGVGRGSTLNVQGAMAFPHSLGIYYTALTQYLGFWEYGDEYKVMGLAAYGQPEYQDEFEKIVRLDSSPARSNGRAPFHLGLDYFVHHKTGPEMTWREGSPVLGKLYSDFLDTRLGPSRKAGAVVDRRHEQIAATVQARLEEAVFTLLNRLYELHGIKKLCLAGGVAFNCVTNGKIFQRTPFEEIFIQPAAGDAGLAVGAAFYVWHQILGRPRSFEMQHAYWGPEFSRARIGEEVAKLRMADAGLRIEEAAEEALVKKTAQRIAEGRVVGWFQGRMEWGPRALGNRSILTDPRRPEMKEVLNARIKRREPFRPFCPSILAEAVDEYFEGARHDPFMITVYPIKPEKHSVIPAVTHVDGTGRLQSVRREDNPLYRELIQAFRQLTGVPVLLNTSFNENEPIVNTPAEAVDCFLRTKMDVLAIGPYFLEKKTSSTDAHG